MPRIRARRSPCCLPRSGNGLSQQSPKTRGDYLASVHIQKRRGFMAQRDSCWRLQSAEIRACPGERARKSAQEPLWHRCSVSHGPRGPGSRVSVLSCVLSKPLPGILSGAETKKTKPESRWLCHGLCWWQPGRDPAGEPLGAGQAVQEALICQELGMAAAASPEPGTAALNSDFETDFLHDVEPESSSCKSGENLFLCSLGGAGAAWHGAPGEKSCCSTHTEQIQQVSFQAPTLKVSPATLWERNFYLLA